MTAYTALLSGVPGGQTGYLNSGLAIDRPASLDIPPTSVGFYYAYDTFTLSIWSNGAWQSLTGSGTVTNVATTGPGITGGPITGAGTLAVEWNAGTVSTVGTGLSLTSGTLVATGVGSVTTIVAGAGLDGGTITSSGTISLGTIAAGDLLGNPGTAGAPPSGVAVGSGLTLSAGGTLSVSAGGGSVTSVIAQGGPFLANGTITSAGTIDNSTTSLTANAILLGAGTSAVTALGSLGGPTTVLHGNASGAPSFSAVDLTSDVTSLLPFASLATLAASSLFGNGTTVGATGSSVAIGAGLSLSVAGTLNATGGAGSVTSVVAGSNLNVGAGPGGTITSAGTLNIQPSPTFTLSGTLPALVQGFTAVPVSLPAATVLALNGAANANANLVVDAYGTSGTPRFEGRQAGLTGSSLDITHKNDVLVQFTGDGYNGSAYTGLSTSIIFRAVENFTSLANGTGMLFRTTKAGGTTTVDSLAIDGSGQILIGNSVTASGTLSLHADSALVDTLNAGTLAGFPLGTGLTLSAGSILPNYQAGTLATIGTGLTLTSGTLTASGSGGTVTQVVTNASPYLNSGTITSSGTITAATLAASSLIGNAATTAAVPGAIAVGTGLTLAAGTLTAGGGAGSVTSVVAGANLNVGAGPGGTITGTGTLNIQPSPTFTLAGTLPAIFNANTGVPTPIAGTLLEVVAADANTGRVNFYSYGNGGFFLSGVGFGGPQSAPTAVASGTGLLALAARGYDGTGVSSSQATIGMFSAENWTPTAHGTSIQFRNTVTGTTTQITPLAVDGSGQVLIGNGVAASGTLAMYASGALIDTISIGTVAAAPLGAGLAVASGSIVPNYQAGSLTTIGSGVTLTSGTLTAGGSGGTVTQIVAGSNLTGGTITGSGTIAIQASPTFTLSGTLPVVINGNSAIPVFPAGTLLQIVGVDGSVSGAITDAFGGNPVFIGRRAQGTEGSPTAVQNTNALLNFGGRGYGATAYSAANRAAFSLRASENWSDTAQGAQINFQITPTGGTLTADAMVLQASGILTIGATTTSGTNKLQVTGGTSILSGGETIVGGVKTDNLDVSGTLSTFPINTGLVLTSGTLNVNTGTSGAVVPLLNTANSWSAAQRGVPVTLTSAATVTPDFSLGNNFAMTMTVSGTLANPTNVVAGQAGQIAITQDGTGGRTLALGSIFKTAGGAGITLTTTAAATDILSYYVWNSTLVAVSPGLNWK